MRLSVRAVSMDEIGRLELPAPPADARRCPRGDRSSLREPEGDVASPHEGSVVLAPSSRRDTLSCTADARSTSHRDHNPPAVRDGQHAGHCSPTALNQRTNAGLGDGRRLTRQDGPRGDLRVDGVGLAGGASRAPVAPIHFHDTMPRSAHRPCQAGAIAAGAFDAERFNPPVKSTSVLWQTSACARHVNAGSLNAVS